MPLCAVKGTGIILHGNRPSWGDWIIFGVHLVKKPGSFYVSFIMLEAVKKTLLAGIGATVVTVEMLEKSLNDLVEKGKISTDEAKDMASKIIDDSKSEYDEARKTVEGWFEDMIEKAGLVKKSKLEAMSKRLDELEAELSKVKSK